MCLPMGFLARLRAVECGAAFCAAEEGAAEVRGGFATGGAGRWWFKTYVCGVGTLSRHENEWRLTGIALGLRFPVG